jgi:hypothetical protein
VADAPHLAYPFRLARSGASVVEEDSQEELVSIAWLCARTPLGYRPEAPDWGTPDLTFTLNASATLAAAVNASDERIAALASERRSALDEALATITLNVGFAS